MKQISTFSSLFILGTTFGFFVKSWLTPSNFDLDLQDEEVHLYL